MTGIAVLGAGIVGRTLAARSAGAGYEVVLGSRDPTADGITAAVAETHHPQRSTPLPGELRLWGNRSPAWAADQR